MFSNVHIVLGQFDLPHRTFMEKSHEVAQQLVEATEIQRVYDLHSVR